MVDATAVSHDIRASRAETAASASAHAISVDVRAADAVALADYRAFCEHSVIAPAQHPVWIEAWIGATDADAIVVSVARARQTMLCLVLEVVRRGPFTIARYPGGNHANGSFPAAREGHGPLRADEGAALADAIRKARPDIDLVALERHTPELDGSDNPLAALATSRSPNIALQVDLDGGFDAVLERMSGKRKLKKYRLQVRKFEEAGGHTVIQARCPAETERLLDEFLVMKASRFAKMGIPNVFDPPEIQAFFRALFRNSVAEPAPPFVLDAVEVGGEIKAVNGLSFTGERVVCEFGSIRDDGTPTSPGFFLDFTNIKQACDDGRRLYDFSVGDEEYKRSWCSIQTWQFDCFWPLSAKGRMLHAYRGLRSTVVGYIKSHEALWSIAKKMRRRLSGQG